MSKVGKPYCSFRNLINFVWYIFWWYEQTSEMLIKLLTDHLNVLFLFHVLWMKSQVKDGDIIRVSLIISAAVILM